MCVCIYMCVCVYVCVYAHIYVCLTFPGIFLRNHRLKYSNYKLQKQTNEIRDLQRAGPLHMLPVCSVIPSMFNTG